jgi:hypothetical protein
MLVSAAAERLCSRAGRRVERDGFEEGSVTTYVKCLTTLH